MKAGTLAASAVLVLCACGGGEGAKGKKVAAAENPYLNADLASHLDELDATFVFLDVKRDLQVVYNGGRASKRFSPCSTFKIPNTLIALETKVAAGPEYAIKWDRKKYPEQPFWSELKEKAGVDWARDHTLRTAFKNSVVWYYLELADDIGSGRMKEHLGRFGYGNKDISSGLAGFWLDGSLEVSALEQVEFIKRFAEKGLGLTEETRAAALAIFEREKKDDAVLYAKTGGSKNIAWFVGWVARGEESFAFAFNMSGTYEETAQKRIDLSMAALRELGVWM